MAATVKEEVEAACSPLLQRLQTQKHLTNNYGSTPLKINKLIQDLIRPHIESFNYFLSEGLMRSIQDITPQEFTLPKGERISLSFRDATIGIPCVTGNVNSSDVRLYPSECRLRSTSYTAKLNIKLTWFVNGHAKPLLEKCVGDIPIMVKSRCCSLSGLSPKELVAHGEEQQEFGGYFIVNGKEKLLRMLIMQRRNYPLAMIRPNWRNRGKLFSSYGVSIRCVKADQFASNMVLHYLTNGTAKLMFTYLKEMFFVPIVLLLKALCDYTDRQVYIELTKGKEDDSYYKGCITNMLRQVQDEGLLNRKQIMNYIGERFRSKVKLADWYSNRDVTEFVLKYCICTHVDGYVDKFNLLVFMTKKLFAAVNGQCALETTDNPMNQEVLLGGHLYLNVLKEKLAYWLLVLRQAIERKAKTASLVNLSKGDVVSCMRFCADVTRAMEYFIATGNVISTSGLGLQQTSGFAVIAEKLNYLRFVAHFRCVHRGSFFAEMRTTEARKLLPESWGFVCPVHTPDGAPCGLLNHLAAACEIVTYQPQTSHLPKLLSSYGMTPISSPSSVPLDQCYTVLLDGRPLGYVHKDLAASLAVKLRQAKSTSNLQVSPHMEICLVPFTGKPSQYPGLYLFSTPCRMLRPVRNLRTGMTEFIGTFEQVYLNIAVTAKEIYPQVTSHLELQQASMLSFSANLIPLSDFNQSPRNMYQCQMAKQTMGTPAHALKNRIDSKLYRILTPQSPLFRPIAYDQYGIDDYPLGTNAVVAVISYTGYDMEDAMILNKASFERGFAHGVIYKNEFIDLSKRQRTVVKYFGRLPEDHSLDGRIGLDGLPLVGTFLKNHDPFYCTMDVSTGKVDTVRYKALESAYVEDVILLGSKLENGELQRVNIRLRMPRNPTIGDKFASRHGQKGICSQKWPQENMPFTESGMTPDIIFNPHGFPSRMTIGMMIESMAGKSAASHGLVHDASPFEFSEKDSAIEHFGKMLEAAGYNYYGTERMYSGVNGRELNADIFFGVVYYQRLRHMVADKYQVRTTGPIDAMTKQPIHGRKVGGGIRFGEMERDSLLAHGVACLLQDRLFNCSDRSLDYVCIRCGGLLSPILSAPKTSNMRDTRRSWTCPVCETKEHVQLISLPFVFRYLVAELASVNIKVFLKVIDPQGVI